MIDDYARLRYAPTSSAFGLIGDAQHGLPAGMPGDAITPCAEDPLEVQLAGKLCWMINVGKLKYLDP
jgi:hypothetical protein